MGVDLAAIRDPNRAGQAYALTFLTPIVAGEEAALRARLERLPDAGGRSPFARLRRTHFARFVICDGFVTAAGQPQPDPLHGAYLLFSCCIDGDPDSYLAELTTTLAPVTEQVYGHCINAPSPASGPALADYLRHNQIKTGFFYSAYPEWTVPEVERVLRQQATLRRLAVAAPLLSPAELQRRFLDASWS